MSTKGIYLLGVGHATPLFIELAEACICEDSLRNESKI